MAATPISISLVKTTAGRKDGVFTAQLTWSLHVSVAETEVEMLADVIASLFPDLPVEGETYPGKTLVTCRGVKVERIEGGYYKYVADYSDENSFEEDRGTNENPLLDRPRIRPVGGMQSRSITRDRDDEGILNSANDPILQSMDDNIVGFQITQNVAEIPSYAFSLRNTCNSAPITIGGIPVSTNAARYVLPNSWLSDPKKRNDITYYEFSFELLIDERDTHYGYPLDAGFRKTIFDDDFNLIQVAITLDDGSEPSEPVPLNGEGDVLEDPTPDNAVYRIVKKYPEADYSALPGVASNPGP